MHPLPGLVAVCLALLTSFADAHSGAVPTVSPEHRPVAAGASMPNSVVLSAPPARLRIPAVNVDATRFVDLDLNADGTLQVPADGHTVGWYTRSPAPGRPGPAVLAAHVDWNHQKGVFYDLHALRVGDRITVDRSDQSTGTFQVSRVAQYPKNSFPSAEVYGDVPGPELRLITCGGEIDRRARSYRDNIVVYARLV
jgi:sortase (surface protein transpeptidase)